MPAVPWRQLSEPHADHSYLVMASRLPLHSYRTIPTFLRMTAAIARQLEHSEGLIGYSLLAQPTKKTFWTLSAWMNQQKLHAFVRTMPHRKIMKALQPYMEPTRFTTWEALGSALPIDWRDAIDHLNGAPSRGSASPRPPR
jgi:quinol monooxygenase YgiN